MTPTRRNFLKAAVAFCVAPVVFKVKPPIITVNNKSQYEGHVPQDIPMGEPMLLALADGERVPVARIKNDCTDFSS